jgi:hypothetical protein
MAGLTRAEFHLTSEDLLDERHEYGRILLGLSQSTVVHSQPL